MLLISKQACDLVTALGMDDKKRGTGRRLHLPFWSLASHGSELADRIQGWPSTLLYRSLGLVMSSWSMRWACRLWTGGRSGHGLHGLPKSSITWRSVSPTRRSAKSARRTAWPQIRCPSPNGEGFSFTLPTSRTPDNQTSTHQPTRATVTSEYPTHHQKHHQTTTNYTMRFLALNGIKLGEVC